MHSVKYRGKIIKLALVFWQKKTSRETYVTFVNFITRIIVSKNQSQLKSYKIVFCIVMKPTSNWFFSKTVQIEPRRLNLLDELIVMGYLYKHLLFEKIRHCGRTQLKLLHTVAIKKKTFKEKLMKAPNS